jgi:beta-N-acetylhexosaminidase
MNFTPDESRVSFIEAKLQSMTLREKIAQMIISYSDGYSLDENSKEFLRLKHLITDDKIGGIIFFKGNSIQQANLTNRLQELSETPLLISQDCERGTGMRLDDGSIFPSNMAIGATRDETLAYQMGVQIAKECKALGVHQNYAPVMDVNNNPDNPIINVRSFGEDPELVSKMGIQMIKGLQETGIIATAKHFPGHGDTKMDSHNDLPVINFDKERLERIELLPFRNAIDEGVKSVMTAHISFPLIENNQYIPSSLSGNIIQKILIEELQFKGLIITDALNMSGITKHFSSKEVAVMAVKAGIDLILMPQGEDVTIDAIESAVRDGIISEDRIDASVKKILDTKQWLKLFENKFVDVSAVSKTVNSEESKMLSQKIADASITKVKDNNGNIPFGLKKSEIKESCIIVSLNNGSDNANSDYFIKNFTEKSKHLFGEVPAYDIKGEITNSQEILNESKNYSKIVIPIFAKVKIKTGTVGLPTSQIDLINDLVKNGKSVIVISFGNPYLLQGFKDIDTYICAYGDCESTINATLKAMFGEIQCKGKLPISISEEFKFGAGLTK